MLELTVGVIRIESVCLPSSRIGLLVVLVTFMVLFLIAASVGGGQLLNFMASTTTFWSGRSVFIFRWSPGKIILLALIDTSRIVAVSSSFEIFLSGFCMFCMFCGWCVLVFVCSVLRLVLIRCATGNKASHFVVGTVHLLPSSKI